MTAETPSCSRRSNANYRFNSRAPVQGTEGLDKFGVCAFPEGCGVRKEPGGNCCGMYRGSICASIDRLSLNYLYRTVSVIHQLWNDNQCAGAWGAHGTRRMRRGSINPESYLYK